MPNTVLIVDDEPNIVLSVEFLMKREGHEVQTAGDGREDVRWSVGSKPGGGGADVRRPVAASRT